MQSLDFFLWLRLGYKVITHGHYLVNQRLGFGFDGIDCRMQFLRNFNQFFLSGDQRGLKLRQQGHQLVNCQLNLGNHLVQDASQGAYCAQGLFKQAGRSLTRCFNSSAGGCNGGLDGGQACLDTHEQNAGRHQRRRPHHVAGTNGDGIVATHTCLIKFGTGCNQRLVSALHKISDAQFDIFNQGFSSVDLVVDNRKPLR